MKRCRFDRTAGSVTPGDRAVLLLAGGKERMTRRYVMTTVGLIVQIAALTTPAQAVGFLQTPELIEQALDESTSITLEDIKLGDAMSVITEQTGVRIVMSPETMAMVPQGASTRIHKVAIANIPLRQGLIQLFSPLGMECFVTDDHVEVVAKRAIRQLGRRASWDELETLSWLSSMSPGINDEALRGLQSRVQFQVESAGAWEALRGAMRNVGAGPGDEVLTVACKTRGWGWTLSGRKIVIAPLEAQIRRRLGNRISLSLFRKPLFDVMTAIGEKVSVRVHVEPGALQHLPVQIQRAVDLDIFQETAQEALDKLAAYTGLGYLIGPDGVMFYRPNPPGLSSPSSNGGAKAGKANTFRLSDPYVAKMVVPLANGTSMEWLIRLSEMPEDLRDMRQSDIQMGFDALRESRRSD